MKRFVRLLWKSLLWLAGGIIALLVLAFLLIQVPSVQQHIKNKAVLFLESKIKTRVEIRKLSFEFPKIVVLEGVYFEDQNQDTLLAGDTLKVDISLFKLLNNEVEINLVDLRGITAYVRKSLPDSTYNFDYIVKAFVREDKKASPSYDSAAAMRFSVHKINLDRIRVKYDDEPGGNAVSLLLGHFETRIGKFDLDKMEFNVPEISLSDVEADLHQTQALSREAITTDTAYIPPAFTYPDIRLGTIDLSQIRISYTNTVTAVETKTELGRLVIEFEKVDLRNQIIKVDQIQLSDLTGSFALGTIAQKAVEATAEEIVTVAEKGWEVQVSKVGIENTHLAFDDLSTEKQKSGLDFNHLVITSLQGELADLSYLPDAISGKVQQFSFVESSGLELKKFQTDFYYSDKKASLKDLVIETPGSLIRDQIEFTYPSLEVLSGDIGVIGVEAHIDQSSVSFRDIMLFVPSVATMDAFKKNPDGILQINGVVSGRVNHLVIPNLEVSGFGQTRFKGSGSITGLPDTEHAHFDLKIEDFTTQKTDYMTFIPAGSIPENIHLPESLQARGIFKGTFDNFQTTMQLRSNLGDVVVDGRFKNLTHDGKEVYDARLVTNSFDVGTFLSMDDVIGTVTFTGEIKGAGTDPKTADIQFDGEAESFSYKGYTYRNLHLKGNSVNGLAEATATMSDPNIAFDLVGTADLNGEYPKLNVVIEIENLNLQALGFMEDDLHYSGTIIADLETADPDHLNGSIVIAQSKIAMEDDRYRLDTVRIISVATEDLDTLSIQAEFLQAHLYGKYQLTQVGQAFVHSINTYYNITPVEVITDADEPQQFVFDARLTRSPLVVQLLPDLEDMEDFHLQGSFDSRTGEIIMEGGVSRLQYKDIMITELELEIKTDAEALNYEIAFRELRKEQYQLLSTSLSGKAQDDILDLALVVKDIKNRNHYRIAGQLMVINGITEFSLLPDGLLLDYESWNVSDDNGLRFGREGLMARNFILSNNGQHIHLHSTPQELNAPLSVRFQDFNIVTLTRLVIRDSLMLGGVVDGEATIMNLQPSPVFTSSLTIENFTFRGDTVGNVSLEVNNEKPDTYAANVSITNKGNEVRIQGYYVDAGEQGRFDLDMNIVQLHLNTIEGFSFGEVDEATGSITGKLKVTGTTASPAIRGNIRFNQADFRITRFNSHFRLHDEQVYFTDEGLEFRNFTMVDRSGNNAVIDGKVFTTDYKDYRFGLTVSTDDFQVLNSTRDNNKLYYGQLFVDTRMRISGSVNNPVVDGNVRVRDKTSLTIVVPQTDRGIVEREGIVEFVDMDDPHFQEVLEAARDSLSQTDITGMDVSVTININRNAELNLIIDEANGDYLRVKGGGVLNGGIDQSGKVTLTGSYQLEEGVYSLTFNFVKREFQIRKGSTITWTGEPMTANVDVTAIYIANAAPLDLVQNQLGDATPDVVNTYKQKLPFEILLTMKGELLKPEISFDIDLPKRNYGVSGDVISTVDVRLAQLRTEPAELNKQVFAVLLLNRFVSDNPFQNAAGGGGVSSLARQSASKLLSEQLNNLVGGMIAGFDLHLDLNTTEDYTSGELKNRTNLTVGLSKQLLSDRLKVTIGSDFELEGPQETNRKSTNIAGNVSAEYQLTKDGRYLVRAYRKDEYIVILGQVVETGVGFVINTDYDKFKDIFAKRTPEEQEFRKIEREVRKQEKKEEIEEEE